MAQENDSISQSEKEWIELVNYTPKNFIVNLKNKPISKFLQTDLNTVWKLKTAYEKKEKLSIYEIQWLEDLVNQLAVAFFLEKKLIVLESVGGYSG
ncbi:hypothetical protein [Winogradskyella forsetii]|uniref:hypothetical protein n=1 Tax=Winogradskyella forsetii TaxID=2686077 RepID=UPI0015BA9691|nr:hypothetical protein [Winogradskyella forsetii]